jgi:hypothetical protein
MFRRLNHLEHSLGVLISALAQVPCLLTHPSEPEQCKSVGLDQSSQEVVNSWLSAIHAIIKYYFEAAPSTDVIKAWRAYQMGLRHIHYTTFGQSLSPFLVHIAEGMRSKQRSERLAAG